MKRKKRLVSLVPHLPEPIVYKRVEAEKEAFDLHLVYWDWGMENLVPKKVDGYEEHRIEIAARRDPLHRLIPYVRFLLRALALLLQLRPDVIHCCGLDALFAAALKNKIDMHGKSRILYEVADLHALQITPQESIARRLLQRTIIRAEESCCKQVDILVTTSEKYYDTYYHRYILAEKHFDFPNVPDLSALRAYRPKDHTKDFTVGYIGGVRYKKSLRNLVTAAESCGIGLMMAGFEVGSAEIESLCRAYEKGEWVGRFDYNTQIATLYERCDVIYSVYDPEDENTKLALPNKLYESIYCGLPILAASGTFLGELVTQWGVGVAVSPDTPDETATVLAALQADADYYQTFVQHCASRRPMLNLDKYNALLLDHLNSLFCEKNDG